MRYYKLFLPGRGFCWGYITAQVGEDYQLAITPPNPRLKHPREMPEHPYGLEYTDVAHIHVPILNIASEHPDVVLGWQGWKPVGEGG